MKIPIMIRIKLANMLNACDFLQRARLARLSGNYHHLQILASESKSLYLLVLTEN